MKKTILAVISLLAVFFLAACGTTEAESSSGEGDVLSKVQEAGVLNVGTSPDYPPYEFYVLDENNEKQIVGMDISLAQALADEIGVDLQLTATDFNGVMANVQTGSVDMGIAGFTHTDERASVVQFSNGYAQEKDNGFQGIMMRSEDAGQYNTLEDLKDANLVIGAQSGSIQYELAQSLTDPKSIKQYGTLDVGLAALNQGDIDAMVISTSAAEPMLTTFPGLTIMPEAEFNLDPENKYAEVMITFPQGEEYASLIDVANQVIAESEENGNLQKWRTEAEALSKEAVE